MSIDFPMILVLATLVTGGIWAVDALFWAPRRRVPQQSGAGVASAPERGAVGGAVKEPVIVEYARSFFPVVLAVLVLRSFLVEPFRIPSGSMMPTLLVGDFILVNKFAYGIRLPVLDTKLIEMSEPQRGDVVVFRYPQDPKVDYIKRVIGVPGDRVAYYDKVVFVNGQRMAQEADGTYAGVGAGAVMTGAQLRTEQLGELRHEILIRAGQPTVEGEFVVPPGQYFVMGDNRDNSNDSRYWGPVPEENLVGKAFLIWMNWDSENGGVSWSRIGSTIH
jgi:signal peptidase I